jgi:excisionase family DNA binding protein
MPISVGDELMSVRQAADFVGMTEAGMRGWIHRGRIDYVKVGSLVKIRRSVLEARLKQGERPARAEANTEETE